MCTSSQTKEIIMLVNLISRAHSSIWIAIMMPKKQKSSSKFCHEPISWEWLQEQLKPLWQGGTAAKTPDCKNDPNLELTPLNLQIFISIHPNLKEEQQPQPVQCRNWCKTVRIPIQIPSILQTQTNSPLQIGQFLILTRNRDFTSAAVSRKTKLIINKL